MPITLFSSFFYGLQIFLLAVLYMVCVDSNFAQYIAKLPSMIYLNMIRLRFAIQFHPLWHHNPIANYFTIRHYEKFVRDYERE